MNPIHRFQQDVIWVDPNAPILLKNHYFNDLYFLEEGQILAMIFDHELVFLVLVEVDEDVGRSDDFQHPPGVF